MASDERKQKSAEARKKKRLDRVLVEQGLTETRQKAQAVIMAGQVRVDGKRVEKAGALVEPDSHVEVLEPARYVGRGGLKLEAALEHFGWNVQSKVFLDVGSSTGDRKSTRLNSSHIQKSRMPSSA